MPILCPLKIGLRIGLTTTPQIISFSKIFQITNSWSLSNIILKVRANFVRFKKNKPKVWFWWSRHREIFCYRISDSCISHHPLNTVSRGSKHISANKSLLFCSLKTLTTNSQKKQTPYSKKTVPSTRKNAWKLKFFGQSQQKLTNSSTGNQSWLLLLVINRQPLCWKLPSYLRKISHPNTFIFQFWSKIRAWLFLQSFRHSRWKTDSCRAFQLKPSRCLLLLQKLQSYWLQMWVLWKQVWDLKSRNKKVTGGLYSSDKGCETEKFECFDGLLTTQRTNRAWKTVECCSLFKITFYKVGVGKDDNNKPKTFLPRWNVVKWICY